MHSWHEKRKIPCKLVNLKRHIVELKRAIGYAAHNMLLDDQIKEVVLGWEFILNQADFPDVIPPSEGFIS